MEALSESLFKLDKERLVRSALFALDLTRRDITTRYRGSVLGVAWALITPLLVLAVFTWTFGTIFQSRGPQAVVARASDSVAAAAVQPSTGEFALILFTGLIVFNLFADVINRAPGVNAGVIGSQRAGGTGSH